MDIYSLNRMVQIEHQHRVRSLRPVPEFGYQIVYNEPRWIACQAEKLLTAVRNGRAALIGHFQQGQAITLINRDQITN